MDTVPYCRQVRRGKREVKRGTKGEWKNPIGFEVAVWLIRNGVMFSFESASQMFEGNARKGNWYGEHTWKTSNATAAMMELLKKHTQKGSSKNK